MGDDFVIEFEYSTKNEWKVFRKSIFAYIGLISGFIYFLVTKEEVGLYIGFVFLFVIVPQLILHIQYNLNDRNKRITVNHSKLMVRIEKNGKFEKEFYFKDVNRITRHKGQKDENNSINAIPTFFYNYTEILLIDGQKIFFTDFVANNIRLKNIKIEEKQSLFNLIIF